MIMDYIEAKHVIIGAGAMGSAAAYHLSRRGEPVVLIEQFALGHNRGSSHGLARITRHSYADPRYARLMPEAFRAWKDLEADAGETVFIRTGGVSFCPHGVDYVDRVAANLKELEVACWQGSGRAWNERHPVFGLPDDYAVVFEPDAGLLRASARRRASSGAGQDSRRRQNQGARSNARPANRPEWSAPDRRD